MNASKREKYLVVTYIEPFIGNELALGYDIRSDYSRRVASDMAGKTGQLTVAESIQLVQDSHGQYGVLYFLPVYQGGG